MNFLKRAWFAVIRKPSRSIIMLVIFFVIANMVLTGLAIQHATEVAEVNARKQLGGTLTLTFDREKAIQNAMSSASSTTSSGSRARPSIQTEPVTESMAALVAKQKNIISYNIIATTYAMAKNFTAVKTTTSSSSSSSSSSSKASTASTAAASAPAVTDLQNAAGTQAAATAAKGTGLTVMNLSTTDATQSTASAAETSSATQSAVSSQQAASSQPATSSQSRTDSGARQSGSGYGGYGDGGGPTRSGNYGYGYGNGTTSGSGSRSAGGYGGYGGYGSGSGDPRIEYRQMNMIVADVTVVGVSATALYDDFNDGSSKIVSGRGITTADKGKRNVVIEQTLASANSLKVGSVIKMTAPNSSTQVSYTVVGIYEATSTSSTQQGPQEATYSESSNRIYTDYASVLELQNYAKAAESTANSSTQRTFGLSDNGISEVVYYVDDPKNIDKAESDIKKMNIDWTKFTISADDSAYQTMIGAIQNVAKTSMLIVYVVAIVGALILALIMLLNVRERMFETGVMLSMGESKGKILMQFIAEMLMIAVVAFAVSGFTSQYISKYASGMLLQNELTTEASTSSASAQNQNSPFGQNGNGFNGGTRQSYLNQQRNQNVSTIKALTVTISWYEFGGLCLAGLIIILLATIIPAVSIMRFNPKSILTRAG